MRHILKGFWKGTHTVRTASASGCSIKPVNSLVDMAHAPQRGGGAKLDDDLWLVIFMFSQPVQGVLKNRQVRGVVLRMRPGARRAFRRRTGVRSSAISSSSVETITRVQRSRLPARRRCCKRSADARQRGGYFCRGMLFEPPRGGDECEHFSHRCLSIRCQDVYQAVQPPSTTRFAPVI